MTRGFRSSALNCLQVLVCCTTALMPIVAYAGTCSNPAGAEGDAIYNNDYHILQYCNGTHWIAAGTADPEAYTGTLIGGKWCTTDGAAINCTSDTPVLVEVDPKIGTLTNSKLCTTNGTVINCTATEADPKIGTLTSGKVCTTNGTTIDCTTDGSGLGTADNLGNHVAAQNIKLGSYWLSGDGGNEGVFVGSTGNVGIGTTSPGATLHVAAPATTAPSLTWGAAAGTILRAENSELALGLSNSSPYPYYIQGRTNLNGVRDVALQPLGGNIGIGTTTPLALLELKATDYPVLSFHDANTATYKLGVDAGSSGVFKIAAMENGFGGAGGDFAANDTQILSMSPSGGVGIGTTTPGTKLDVAGDLTINRNYLYLAGPGDSNHAIHNTAGDGEEFRFWNFLNLYQANGAASRLYIDGSGRVGVGTTAPNAKLDVAGAARLSDSLLLRDANGLDGKIGALVSWDDTLYFQRWSAAQAHEANVATLNLVNGWFSGAGYSDFNDGNYYVDPNGSTRLNGLTVNGCTGCGGYDNLGNHTATTALNLNGNSLISGANTIWDGGGGWLRTYGQTGWYSQTYGGGWYMTDSTWVRAYNGKNIWSSGVIQADGNMTSPIFYDLNDGAYYSDPNWISRLNKIHPNVIDCVAGICPPNSVLRLTPNLHLNSGAGSAVILNWDNGTTGATQTLRVGNGAGADAFYVRADGYVWTSQYGWMHDGFRRFNTWQNSHYSGTDGNEYATVFTDANDGNYYVNPNGDSKMWNIWLGYMGDWLSSRLNQNVTAGAWPGFTGFTDSNDGNYYIDPNGTSYVNDFRPNIIYDRQDANYTLDLNGISWMNDIRPFVIYDRNDGNYYLDPNNGSRLNWITVNGCTGCGGADNLGNHVATTTLNMNGQSITNGNGIYGNTFYSGGTAGTTGSNNPGGCGLAITVKGGLVTTFQQQGWACSDIAEYYLTEGEVKRGDIVALSNETATFDMAILNPDEGEQVGDKTAITVAKVRRADATSRARILGVVPTFPMMTSEKKLISDDTPQEPVTLGGHAPVRVTLEGGSIAIGDPITISQTVAGAGTKATTSGRIIGYALEPCTAEQVAQGKKMVEVFIRLEDWVAPKDAVDISELKAANDNLQKQIDELKKIVSR